MASAEVAVEPLLGALGAALGRSVVALDRLPGGRNSRIYRARDAAGMTYAVKAYTRRPGRADSLVTEVTALRFLRGAGVDAVAAPVAWDEAEGWAAFEYLEGTPVAGGDVDDGTIAESVAFLAALRGLRTAAGADALPPAAEAALSVQAVLDNIAARRARLQALAPDTPEALAMHAFVANAFTPAFDTVAAATDERLARAGQTRTSMLPRTMQTLSPSDFGFHNAIRRPDGRLAFVDFEFFGWDDPAKMVSDFLLHPGMNMAEPLRAAFARRIAAVFADDVDLGARVEMVYPLFGLKWCLILLNEFVGADLRRRHFAGDATDAAALQRAQLAKARTMLEKVRKDHERFPYRF